LEQQSGIAENGFAFPKSAMIGPLLSASSFGQEKLAASVVELAPR
jgi:hypothetical protein